MRHQLLQATLLLALHLLLVGTRCPLPTVVPQQGSSALARFLVHRQEPVGLVRLL
jgi:hypothetical protein